jgi:hypothetical protein
VAGGAAEYLMSYRLISGRRLARRGTPNPSCVWRGNGIGLGQANPGDCGRTPIRAEEIRVTNRPDSAESGLARGTRLPNPSQNKQ